MKEVSLRGTTKQPLILCDKCICYIYTESFSCNLEAGTCINVSGKYNWNSIFRFLHIHASKPHFKMFAVEHVRTTPVYTKRTRFPCLMWNCAMEVTPSEHKNTLSTWKVKLLSLPF